MDDRAMAELRGILAPLDLVPLFQVVAGEHLQGLATPDSPVAVRGVHREALGAAHGEGRRIASLRLDLLDRGMSVRFRSEDREHAARRILEGDVRLLESIHSPFVLSGEEDLRELREIAVGFLTRRIAGHYRRLADRALEEVREQVTRRLLSLLRLFRALLAGTHVLETGELLPDLPRLVVRRRLPYLSPLAAKPWKPALVGDPAFLGFLFGEAEALRHTFENAAAGTRLPERPAPEALERLARWAEPGKCLGGGEDDAYNLPGNP